MTSCTHVQNLRPVRARSTGCEECLKLGDEWVHLRLCRPAQCRLLRLVEEQACDQTLSRHAPSGDALLEPGEHWMWCYVDVLAFETAE